ncbi:gamma-aminobutyric acid type B receptor subunit 1-like [Apostichopus japonicus]|uniref:gamma-aminobutyric acid type B receptor subunit 1-like n=1 Tax=Stichopus japonicus TaxID=307972 RepID=UPI003AB7E682
MIKALKQYQKYFIKMSILLSRYMFGLSIVVCWFCQILPVVGKNDEVYVNCSSPLCASSELKEKIPLYIGGIFSMSGLWDGSGCLVAAELALEQINNRSDILPDYELKMLWNDSQCDASKSPRILFDHIFNEPKKIILLGPPCSSGAMVVSSASVYWNLITVIYSALSPSLSDRSKYLNVYRTVPIALRTYNDPLIWLMKRYGWRRVGYLSISSESFLEVQRNFITRVTEFNATVITEVVSNKAQNQIENLQKEDVRIIFSYVIESLARVIFCEAYKVGFYGDDKVWVLPYWYRNNWWQLQDDKVDCSEEEMSQIVESSLILGIDVSVISPLDRTTVAGTTPAEFLEEIGTRLYYPQYNAYTANNYMAYTYDSVWAIGLALNYTAKMLLDSNETKHLEDFTYMDNELYNHLFDGLAKVDFFGASGDVSYSNGERLGNSDVTQLRGQCPLDWILFERNCYQFVHNKTANWDRAVTSCQNNNAYLADVSETEIDLMRKTLSLPFNLSSFEWYVGFIVSGIAGSDQRVLTDLMQRVINFKFTDDISGDCIFLDLGNENIVNFKAGRCLVERPYICKVKAVFSPSPVAVYTAVTDEMIWRDEIIWSGDGNVPLDGSVTVPITKERIERLIPSYLHILVMALALSGMLLTLAIIFCVTWFFRKRVRYQPLFDYVILCSCLVMFASTVITKSQILPQITDQQNVFLIQARNISTSVGFTLVVASLVGQIWFIYQASLISMSNTERFNTRIIYILIGVALIIDVICLLILHLYYPVELTTFSLGQETDPKDPYHVIEYYVTTYSNGDGWIPHAMLLVDKAVLLLAGSFLSFEVLQGTANTVAEGKKVAVCIYNIILFSICGLVLVFLLDGDPISAFAFSSTLIICCTSMTVLMLFIPKLLLLMKMADSSSQDTSLEGLSGDSHPSTSHSRKNNIRNSLNLSKKEMEENARLRAQYEKLQHIVHKNSKAARGSQSEKI